MASSFCLNLRFLSCSTISSSSSDCCLLFLLVLQALLAWLFSSRLLLCFSPWISSCDIVFLMFLGGIAGIW